MNQTTALRYARRKYLTGWQGALGELSRIQGMLRHIMALPWRCCHAYHVLYGFLPFRMPGEMSLSREVLLKNCRTYFAGDPSPLTFQWAMERPPVNGPGAMPPEIYTELAKVYCAIARFCDLNENARCWIEFEILCARVLPEHGPPKLQLEPVAALALCDAYIQGEQCDDETCPNTVEINSWG